MGGYGPMIAENMAQKAVGDVARQRQLQDEQRKQNLALNWGVLNNPDATIDQKQAAQQGIQSLYPTPFHAPQFLQDILHLKGRAQEQQASQQAQSQANAATNTPPSQTAPIAQSTVAAQPPESTSGPVNPPPSVLNPAAMLQGGQGVTAVSPQAAPPPSAAPAPLAQVRAVGAAQNPDQALSILRGYTSPAEQQNILAQRMQQAMMQREIELAKARGEYGIQEALIRAQGNVSMQKLNGAAQSLGAEDFASAPPEVKMQAIKALHMAGVTSTWKSVQDGNNIYAVPSNDPNGQRTLIGHKSDLTSRIEYKVMTNADGSQSLVPVTTWTRKGSTQPLIETQDESPISPPVSANTPPGPSSSGGAASPVAPPVAGGGASPSSPLAAVNNLITQGNATSKKLNKGKPQTPMTPSSSVGAPIPFGSKGSPLLKSDTAQYTKFAEDANTKQLAWQNAQQAAQNPTPTSDQELIYTWVRSNVQGAGRMTQAEFKQAGGVGSVPTKLENWFSMVTTGKMTPQIRQYMLRDIKMSADNSKRMADTYRKKVDDEMHGRKPETAPISTQTPAGPSGGFDWNSAPVHQ